MKERKESLSNIIRGKFEDLGLEGDIVITAVLELEINLVAALNGATLEEHIIASLFIPPSVLVTRKIRLLLKNKPEISLTHHWFTDEEQL